MLAQMSRSWRGRRDVLLETGDVSFADIGGMDDVIKQIQQVAVVSLLHPELFLKAGKSPIRGILLHGEPGTEKSLTAESSSQGSTGHLPPNLRSRDSGRVFEGLPKRTSGICSNRPNRTNPR